MIRNGFKRRGDDDPENPSPLAYFYRNNDVYKFCKSKKGEPSKPLSEFINSQRQKFTAHTIRQPNSRHTKQLLFNDDKYHRTGNHSGPLLNKLLLHGTSSFNEIRDFTMETPTFTSSEDVVQNN